MNKPIIDKKYIAARDALIPAAEDFANQQFGKSSLGMDNKGKVEYAQDGPFILGSDAAMSDLWGKTGNSSKGGRSGGGR
jgi:hypothetical protein